MMTSIARFVNGLTVLRLSLGIGLMERYRGLKMAKNKKLIAFAEWLMEHYCVELWDGGAEPASAKDAVYEFLWSYNA